MDVPEKSIFGLLGPNGAGKTTLIRIINQIIESDEGEVLLNGQPLSPDHIRAIGYLPEERGLYKKMKVLEQIVYFGRLKDLSAQEAQKRALYWLEKFDLLPWKFKKIEELSKGMAQKVQFILTVLHEPELIIFDEPFSGFDPVNTELIKDEIKALREHGATIIFSTHRMESVEEICDYMGMINKSQKVLEGGISEVRNSFRKNLFEVGYIGDFDANGFNRVSLQNNDREGITEATFSLDDEEVKSFIDALNKQVKINYVQEQLPSIKDIFIQQVEEGNHG